MGIKGGSLRSLQGLAVTLAADAQFAEATWMFAVAHANRRKSPGVVRSDSVEIERWIGESRAHLGETSFTAAWARGLVLPLDQAIAMALSQVPALVGQDS
jgi:hypothetical protein